MPPGNIGAWNLLHTPKWEDWPMGGSHLQRDNLFTHPGILELAPL